MCLPGLQGLAGGALNDRIFAGFLTRLVLGFCYPLGWDLTRVGFFPFFGGGRGGGRGGEGLPLWEFFDWFGNF